MRSIFLAVTITTAYAHLSGWPADLHPVLRACFAVLVLVLGIGLWRKRERPATSQARAVRAPRWPDYLAIGLSVFAIECLFLFFLSVLPPRAEELAYAVEATLRPERAAARLLAIEGPGQGTHATVVSGNWLWDDQGNRHLPLSTNARPSNKPEAFFAASDRETSARLLRNRPYLRAFALEQFEDSTWSPLAISAVALNAETNGWVTIPQPAGRPGPALQGVVTLPAQSGGKNVFTALQGATRAKLSQIRRVAPGILRLNPLRNPEHGYTYDAASKTVTFNSLIETGVLQSFVVPKEADPHLTKLPEDEELRQALFDIVFKTQGPIEARLLAIRRYLRSNCQYSLKIENADQRDPVLNFLLHEKRGHCEFFATAGALLCRALDIPARVAYGWSGGRYFESPNLFMFRAREAHSWTEIYLEDVGWVIFDTTPPSALEQTIAGPDEKSPLNEDGEIEPDSHAWSNDDSNLWIYLALAVGVALLPVACFILRFRKRPVTLPGSGSTSLLPDPPGYLARFRQACARCGNPMPVGRTLRQHLATLAHEEQAPSFADDLLDYHYAVTYGEAKPNKLRESALTKTINKWV